MASEDSMASTVSGSSTESLSLSDLQVCRTIRRSPRRFSPVNATDCSSPAVTNALLTPEAGEDGENQGLSQARGKRVLHRAQDIQQNSNIPTNRVTESATGDATHHDVAKDLRRTIERQKRQLQVKVKSLGRARDEVAQLKQQLAELEKELEEKEEALNWSQKNEQQYRNWWLNEIQFTKLLLNKIPDPNPDIELVRSSQAHYLGHY
ncbi:hypothetical protein BKA70DRAFT_1442975 [Coprinopsis sp. MPI-PUGE-AT-0042]|nr:hypothetical protein BKA70DRAFT_1442975 [Coprinopsis sp. MPI-PUGE-AT-0042]